MVQMNVSIIIVNYNTKELTNNCINSIIENTKDVSYEIILVDNASTDGSKELFEDDARVRYIYNNINEGFGKANNLGLIYSTGDYIFLLNSDTILKNNAIFYFFDAMQHAVPNVACMGCILEGPDGNPTKSFGPFLSFKVVVPKHVIQIVNKPISKLGVNVPVVLGADLFIRRSVIDKYGLFDPAFFMYHEENDLQRRYFQVGYISKIINGPKIVHFEGKSNKNKINKRMVEGAYTYMKKWLPYYEYLFFHLVYAITRTPKVFITRCSLIEKINYLKVLYFYKAKKTIYNQ